MSDIEQIIERMIQSCGEKNAAKMSDYIGFSSGSVSQWRKRKNITDGSIAKVAAHTGVSFDWLKTGEGEMRPPPYQEQNGTGHGVAGESGPLSADESELLIAYQSLSLDKRRMFLKIIVEEAKESRQQDGGGSGLAEANSA
jgi:hypothetical protein